MSRTKRTQISYEPAPDIQAEVSAIVRILNLGHIDLERVVCVRSRGTSARRIIARCHGLSKVLQLAMGVKAFYALEFIAERFDKLDDRGREETIIHELMHIPRNFGGGFRHHDLVTDRNVRTLWERYRGLKSGGR